MKILAIDDNKDNLTTLKAVVREALPECEVLTALNGTKGIELARAEDPDVILLDVVMPGMDGFAVCRKLKADETLSLIPVIFVTALRTDTENRIKALEVGAEGFLAKPLDALELTAQVRAMTKIRVASRRRQNEKTRLETLVAERTRELERELAERKQAEAELRLLQTISLTVTEADEFDTGLRLALKAICELTGWEFGEIWLLTQKPLLTARVVPWHADSKSLQQFETTPRPFAFTPGVGLPGRVWQSKQVHWIPDVAADANFPRAAAALAAGLKGAVGVPVLASSEVVAVLAFYVKATREPDDRFVNLVATVAAQLGTLLQRRQAETALRESETRLAAAQALARLGSWEFTPSTNQWTWSEELFRLFQLDPADGVPARERILERIHPEDHATFLRTHDLSHPDFRSGEIRLFFPDGKITWLEENTAPVHDPEGQLVAIKGTSLDITARKTAELRVREQAELLEKAHDSIILTGLDNRFIFWNRGAEQITGWSAAEAIGKTSEEILGSPSILVEAREAVMTAGSWQGEFPTTHRDGRAILLDLSMSLIRDDDGRPRARLSIGTDITERKRLEEQAIHAQRLESLGSLSAGIAHDLNNMLAPILFAGPLLRPSVSSPRDLQILDTLEKSASRGSGLVRQILSFAQGSSSGLGRIIQVKHIAREVLAIVEVTFPKAIQVEHAIAANAWPVRANPTQIHQVLLNLCINARDAMPHGGLLTVKLGNRELDLTEAAAIPGARAGAWVVLEVADSGTGIPPDVLPRIWDAFFTTKAAERGTGLGLATVRGIVDNHNGFIQLETVVGRGSTFRIFLPASPDAESKPDSAQPFTLPAASHDELILVVDDDVSVREIIDALLSREGYRVICCKDGIEAIVSFNAHFRKIALVITDVEMPNLSGDVLIGTLLKLKPDLRIVAMSGLASTQSGGADVSEARRLAAAFLPKPFTVAELLATLQRVLPQPQG